MRSAERGLVRAKVSSVRKRLRAVYVMPGHFRSAMGVRSRSVFLAIVAPCALCTVMARASSSGIVRLEQHPSGHLEVTGAKGRTLSKSGPRRSESLRAGATGLSILTRT
eukprot:3937712-Rhodomonas_salina.1